LELGGKSPILIFPPLDGGDQTQAHVGEIVEWIMFGVFWTNGQICSSTSRCLIHESIAPLIFKRLKEECEKIYVGDPFTNNDPSIGPVVNREQFKIVSDYVQIGIKEGATLLTGGPNAKISGDPRGNYIAPTVLKLMGIKKPKEMTGQSLF